LLRAQLAAGGVDGQGSDDGLGYRDGDLTLALIDFDGSVGLLDDDAF
jgi:hypothetical protein